MSSSTRTEIVEGEDGLATDLPAQWGGGDLGEDVSAAGGSAVSSHGGSLEWIYGWRASGGTLAVGAGQRRSCTAARAGITQIVAAVLCVWRYPGVNEFRMADRCPSVKPNSCTMYGTMYGMACSSATPPGSALSVKKEGAAAINRPGQ